LLKPDAGLEPEFGEAAAADRVAVLILGPELLVAVAAHRPAAARIEATRRRNVEHAGADNRPQPQPPGDDRPVGHRVIGARIELDPPIRHLATVRGKLRTDA